MQSEFTQLWDYGSDYHDTSVMPNPEQPRRETGTLVQAVGKGFLPGCQVQSVASWLGEAVTRAPGLWACQGLWLIQLHCRGLCCGQTHCRPRQAWTLH